MIRRYTAELLAAQAAGQMIVCSVDPYANYPVLHDERSRVDPEPWTVPGTAFRLSGRHCHAVPVTGKTIQRAARVVPLCSCIWVRNMDRVSWDRMTRDVRCSVHGRHDHWSQGCPRDPDGAWVLWMCPEAVDSRDIESGRY